MAVGQLLQTDGIIEVLGIGRVDGDGEGFAEIAAFLDFVPANGNGNPIGFFFNLFRKLYRIFVRCQDGFHLHIVLARLTKHADDFAKGVARAIGPVGEVDDDLHSILGTIEVATRDEDIDRHPVHIGTDEDIAMGYGKHTHKLSVAAFEHLHYFSFGFAVVAFWEHGHTNMVAMQGFIGVVGGDEDILAFTVVAHHVSLARRLHFHRALHILGLRPKLRHTLRPHHITIGAFFLK